MHRERERERDRSSDLEMKNSLNHRTGSFLFRLNESIYRKMVKNQMDQAGFGIEKEENRNSVHGIARSKNQFFSEAFFKIPAK